MHSTSFERSKEINLSISIDSRSEIQTKKNFAHPRKEKFEKDYSSNIDNYGNSNDEGNKFHESEFHENEFHENERSFLNLDFKQEDNIAASKHFCTICKRNFSAKSKLQKHNISYHEGKDPAYKCFVCDQRFFKRNDVLTHFETIHEGIKPYLFYCSTCKRNFSANSKLEKHNKTFHEGKDPPHKCYICATSFFKTIKLLEHFKLVHEGMRPFKCSFCKKRFLQHSHLKRHIITAHRSKR